MRKYDFKLSKTHRLSPANSDSFRRMSIGCNNIRASCEIVPVALG